MLQVVIKCYFVTLLVGLLATSCQKSAPHLVHFSRGILLARFGSTAILGPMTGLGSAGMQ
jgi:hypothetical protein